MNETPDVANSILNYYYYYCIVIFEICRPIKKVQTYLNGTTECFFSVTYN